MIFTHKHHKPYARILVPLILFILVSYGLNVLAAGEPVMQLESHAAILVEPVSGDVLYQKNADKVLPPASVTKLMVMLLTLEALDREKLKLSEVIAASPEACKMGGSQIWLEPGEQMTVAELLKAVCIVSANDASYALGEHLAGSEENFVALMNKRAKELGLKSTNYVNTTGLEPAGGGHGNMTSATDMALLAREVVKYPAVFQWTGVWIDNLRDGKSFLRNTNNLVRFYRGCDGLKTGFTNEAGFCLVATAKRDGVRLLSVVMKAPTSQVRSQDVSKLFNYGFSKYQAHRVYQGGEKLAEIKIFRGVAQNVTAVTAGELTAILRRDAPKTVQKEVHLPEMLEAPVKAGQKIGSVILTVDGKKCGEIALIAEKNVERANFLQIWGQIWREIVQKVT